MGASSARPFTTLKQLQLQAPFLAQRHTVGFESALQRSDRERKEATAAKLAQLSAAHHERRISIILDANVLNFLVAHGVRVNPAQLVATEQGWVKAAIMQQRAATAAAAVQARTAAFRAPLFRRQFSSNSNEVSSFPMYFEFALLRKALLRAGARA
jgi:hypothetical protein